jgi:hypothetical protein
MDTATNDRAIALRARKNRVLANATIGIAAMLLGLDAVVWLIPAIAEGTIAGLTGQPAVAAGPGTRFVVFLIALSRTAILVAGLLAVAALFRLFATGDAFVPRTGQLLRRFGTALVAYTLLAPLFKTAMVAAATWNNTEGERIVTVGVGMSSQGLVFLLTAGLVVALGHVMQEAARLADEHRQIV